MIEMNKMFDLTDSFFMSKLSEPKKGFAEFMLNHKAHVDPHSHIEVPNWTLYIEGYKNAADCLVDCAAEVHEADILVYPIVFLYRHYIELQLKDLLQILYKYHNLSCEPPGHHYLVKLWCEFRTLMERIDKSFWGIEHYDHIEARIKEFDLIDKKSDSFRYPLDRKGNLSHDDIKEIIGDGMLNIFQMKRVINSIYDILQGQSETLYREYGVE